ncbi:MAG TPA: zinc transporter ZntB [Gammaproteobacteria bacterium]
MITTDSTPLETPATPASHDGLLCAYLLDGKGGGRELGWPEVDQWMATDSMLWVHLDYSHPHSRSWLTDYSGVDELVVNTLLAEETRPRLVLEQEGMLVVMRGVNNNPGAEPEDMVSIRVWLEPQRIVTTLQRNLQDVDELRTRIRKGYGPHDADALFVMLTELMAVRVGDVIEELDDNMDQLEDEVLGRQTRQLRSELAEVRRTAISLRRYLVPQREVITRLSVERINWLGEDERTRLREVSDHLTRYVEDLEAIRERAAVCQEELNSHINAQAGQRMYVLAIVAAVFLPLTFITGLLGINVGGIPGANHEQAFAMVVGGLLVVGILLVMLFRWRRWM